MAGTPWSRRETSGAFWNLVDLVWLTGFTALTVALAWAVVTTGGDFSKLDLSRFNLARLARGEF